MMKRDHVRSMCETNQESQLRFTQTREFLRVMWTPNARNKINPLAWHDAQTI